MDREEVSQDVKVFLWHDSVHYAQEDARIQFWRLSFSPTYDYQRIARLLVRNVFPRFDISSYIIYETLGEFDLLLRLWVPRRVDPEELRVQLQEDLQNQRFDSAEYLVVRNVALHWVWDSPTNHIFERVEPDGTLPLNYERVRALDTFNRNTMEWARDREFSPDLMSASVNPAPIIPEWVQEYEDHNYLRGISLSERGIRFYVTFDRPRKTLRLEEIGDITERLAGCCERVARETVSLGHSTEVPQLSLYAGYGSRSEFLVMARAPDSHFYSFMRRLVFGIRDLGIDRLYAMRTFTHVMASRSFTEFKESPKTEPTEVDDSIMDLSESESLEFKASLHLDVRKFVTTGDRTALPRLEFGALKAICGLLNAPRGGTLLLGVMEIARELERSRNQTEEYRQKLVAMFPIYPSVERMYESDAKALIGMEEEYQLGEGFRDWDTFQRYLTHRIAAVIRPNPITYLSLDRREIRGRTIAVVTVRPSESWYYLEESGSSRFYVREIAQSREYSGVEADLYRRGNPRQGS